MRFLPLLMLLGCAAKANKTTMSGIADKTVYFDGWVSVKVHNAPDGKTWVRLNQRQLKQLKDGSRIIFRVETIKVQNEDDQNVANIIERFRANLEGAE